MRGYPQFSFQISIGLVKIYVSCIITHRGKKYLLLVGTVLKCKFGPEKADNETVKSQPYNCFLSESDSFKSQSTQRLALNEGASAFVSKRNDHVIFRRIGNIISKVIVFSQIPSDFKSYISAYFSQRISEVLIFKGSWLKSTASPF